MLPLAPRRVEKGFDRLAPPGLNLPVELPLFVFIHAEPGLLLAEAVSVDVDQRNFLIQTTGKVFARGGLACHIVELADLMKVPSLLDCGSHTDVGSPFNARQFRVELLLQTEAVLAPDLDRFPQRLFSNIAHLFGDMARGTNHVDGAPRELGLLCQSFWGIQAGR